MASRTRYQRLQFVSVSHFAEACGVLQAVIFKPSGPAAQFGYNVKEMHGGGVSPWKVWLPTQEMWTNPLMG